MTSESTRAYNVRCGFCCTLRVTGCLLLLLSQCAIHAYHQQTNLAFFVCWLVVAWIMRRKEQGLKTEPMGWEVGSFLVLDDAISFGDYHNGWLSRLALVSSTPVSKPCSFAFAVHGEGQKSDNYQPPARCLFPTYPSPEWEPERVMSKNAFVLKFSVAR